MLFGAAEPSKGWRHTDDLPGTLDKIRDRTKPVILLAHEPDIFPDVPERVSLTVSGHTHGGQVNVFGWKPVVPSRFGALTNEHNNLKKKHATLQDRADDLQAELLDLREAHKKLQADCDELLADQRPARTAP